MKPAPPPLKVGKPCSKSWAEMKGTSTKRFCEECQRDVHNLSEMSRRERDQFAPESGVRTCIAYELRPDGTMVTHSFWDNLRQPFSRIHSATIALLTLLPFLAARSKRISQAKLASSSANSAREQSNATVSPANETAVLREDFGSMKERGKWYQNPESDDGHSMTLGESDPSGYSMLIGEVIPPYSLAKSVVPETPIPPKPSPPPKHEERPPSP